MITSLKLTLIKIGDTHDVKGSAGLLKNLHLLEDCCEGSGCVVVWNFAINLLAFNEKFKIFNVKGNFEKYE